MSSERPQPSPCDRDGPGEARFRALIEENADGILVVDLEGSIRYANPAAQTLFGKPLDQLLGGPFGLPDVVGDCAELELRNHKGNVVHVEMRVVASEWEGSPAFLASLRNVTERVKAERERQFLEAHLRRSQKLEALGTLAGGIAHGFNNLLAPIQIYAELLLGDPAVEALNRERVEEILKASTRAAEVVGQLLTFSRKDAGTQPLLPVRSFVAEAVGLLRNTVPKNIRIEDNLHAHPFVKASPDDIHHVVMNLCTNAYQAMGCEAGTLTVSLEEVTLGAMAVAAYPELQPGDYAQITVGDDGPGIEPAELDNIFEPFYTTRGPEATGLGLSGVHGIVRRLGGAITVASCPREGATFRVLLPAAAPPRPAEFENGGGFGASPSRGQGHILVIDDECSVVTGAKALLEELGYTVTAKTDPIEALNTLGGDPARFDVIVTDQTMPFMNGTQLVREVAEMNPQIPVLVMTGYSDAVSQDNFRELGFAGYIMKPFSAARLAGALQELCPGIDR